MIIKPRGAGKTGCTVAVTAAILSASASLVMIPTSASAFDIGGMIGTAMAIQMKVKAYRGGGGYAGGYHARVSNHDSDSDDRGSSSRSSNERDARDPDAIDGAFRPANRLALGRPTGGASSSSGGLAQASERDAAADEAVGPRRMSNDHPAFNPSR